MKKYTVIEKGFAFDDVLLMPGYADFVREDVDISSRLTKNIRLKSPLVSAPMDTVTGSELAIALGKAGGIGILHRNLRVAEQAEEVARVKAAGQLVGAATGIAEGFKERVAALVEAGVDVICLDAAHGYTKPMIDAIRYVKETYSTVDVIAGNVATYDGAKALSEAGADGLRVGMGPGAICTTRIISGMGMPQFTAITETVRAAKQYDVPVIADGGIKYSGDIVKALGAGAETVMMGGLFAATVEAPGTVVELTPDQVPEQFRKINLSSYKFKTYRGMGSVGAMRQGASTKAEDEFHGKSFDGQVLVAEGVESLVPVKGRVQEVCDQAIGGIRSGLFYVGAKSVTELQEMATFIQLTQASLAESHPHDVVVTNGGQNY
jgi:IMP dehydrogenase